jgi:predicted peptidase
MRLLIFLVAVGVYCVSPAFCEEPAPGTQVEQVLKVGDGSISYLLYLPKKYTAEGGDPSQRRWPLMLFLHGRGESDGPLSMVKKWGPPNFIEHGINFPYIIASPQCPPSPKSWNTPEEQALLLALLDHLASAFKVDEDRIYLTGLSMGGFGSWRLAADHPERFAAVVPICGGGDPRDADKLKYLPIWVWHGLADNTVPVKRSIEMVDAIKKAGSSTIRLTTLEGIGHVSWQAAYASPDVYLWLDKQSASKNRARATQQ